jgi:hypothetical protein
MNKTLYHDERRKRRLEIVYRPIGEMKPDAANARQHSKKQILKLANSIETFGFNVPVLVDAELNVIAGNGRLAACRELGIAEVPTLCLDHLSPAQLRAFMICDNRLSELANWNDQILAQQLKDLSLLGLDFSLEVTGFEMAEIDLRIASLEELAQPADDPGNAVPEIWTGPSVSKLGDLWLLGRHRVVCGNALDRETFAGLMGEERAAMVFTDPPYNVPIDGHASGLGAIHHRPFPMASGEMDEGEFSAFLNKACRNLAACSAEGSLHYLCIDWRHLGELLAAGRAAYGELKNLCVWVKDNAGMGSLYRSQHELILVFKQGGIALTAIISNWADSGGTAAISGSTLGPTPLPAAVRRATCRRSTRLSNRSRWLQMPSSTVQPAATSCSTPFSAVARQSSPPSELADAATGWI